MRFTLALEPAWTNCEQASSTPSVQARPQIHACGHSRRGSALLLGRVDTNLKVVTQIPLAELWRDDGFTTTSRVRWLTADDITILLRTGRVQFVVADVGASPRWIPLGQCHDFWKRDALPHLAAPESRASLDDFPDSYCYFASEWSSKDGTPIIVCEKHH